MFLILQKYFCDQINIFLKKGENTPSNNEIQFSIKLSQPSHCCPAVMDSIYQHLSRHSLTQILYAAGLIDTTGLQADRQSRKVPVISFFGFK